MPQRSDSLAADGPTAVLVDGSAFGVSIPSTSVVVTVDTAPPGVVSGLTSAAHPEGQCSNDLSVTMTWSPASDGNGCGIDGYGIEWTLGAPALPSAVKDIGAVTSYTQTLFATASPWYFNIRAVDRAGRSPFAWHRRPEFVSKASPQH